MLVGTMFVAGTATAATGQETLGQKAMHLPGAGSLLTNDFSEPTRPDDPSFSRTLGACIGTFERMATWYEYDHPFDPNPAHDTLLEESRLWTPYSPTVISAARDCYHTVYRTSDDVPREDIPEAWLLAVHMNEDSVARALTTRWLALHSTDTPARASWLARAVRSLVAQGGPDGKMHLTDAHVAMARQYLAQLEALGPSQLQKLVEARTAFNNAGAARLDSDSALQVAIDESKHWASFVKGIPSNALSGRGREFAKENAFNAQVYGVERLTYVKTLDHADLTRFVQSVDSASGMNRPWLVGKLAPPVTADYWFGTPSNKAPEVVPAPGEVSLLVFVGPRRGNAATNSPQKDAMLRWLHMKYPSLRIVFVAVTRGYWASESLLDHPEREAKLMYQYVHDSLQVPGIMGVIAMKQQVVTSDGRTLPVEPQLFDQYKIDASVPVGNLFLVDRQGWVVDQGASLIALIPRLLNQPARRSSQR
jgi:hypothetical protein